jgi:hypothetical protein
MDTPRLPEVVREKVSRVRDGRFACALIFDREFSPEEIARFRSLRSEEQPTASDFEISGRVIRYDCPEAEEARWRLAAEIFMVRAFRDAPSRPSPHATDGRRAGPRPRAGPG